jgi:peptide/nickel transport system substrate-binding protein/microcin C transport system substrate-binding protein
MKFRFDRVRAAVLASALVTTSVGLSSAAAAQDEQTFYDTLGANPTSLFPLTNADAELSALSAFLFEELADRHWDTYEWTPRIASKWDVSADGKQYTFTINPKAKFWDGSPVTVEDVKFSYDVIFRDGIRTAEIRPAYENIEKIEIVGKDQVRFTTKNVYYKNFDVCAGLTIFQKKHYEKLLAKDKTMTQAEVTKSPMGTGSWQIEKWDENQQLILKRDQNYWDKETIQKRGQWNATRRVFKIVPEMSVEFEMFKKGDLTYHGFSPKEWALNSDGPEFKTRITKVKAINKAPKGYSYIAWNQLDPVLADKNVRWALSHLVNLNLWVKKFDFSLSEPTIGPYSPKGEEHDPAVKGAEFSLEKARERLAAAGWTKAGKDGVLEKDGKRFEIEIIYPVQAKDVHEPKLTEFKNTAAKVGVAINLKSVEWTSFTKLLDERKFQAVTLAWTREVDPDLKQIWHSDSIANQGSNFVSYKNPEVDKLIDEQRATLDRAKRIELDRKIEKLIVDDQPYTFLTEAKYSLYAHQNYVKKEKDAYNYTIGTSFWKLNNKQAK